MRDLTGHDRGRRRDGGRTGQLGKHEPAGGVECHGGRHVPPQANPDVQLHRVELARQTGTARSLAGRPPPPAFGDRS